MLRDIGRRRILPEQLEDIRFVTGNAYRSVVHWQRPDRGPHAISLWDADADIYPPIQEGIFALRGERARCIGMAINVLLRACETQVTTLDTHRLWCPGLQAVMQTANVVAPWRDIDDIPFRRVHRGAVELIVPG